MKYIDLLSALLFSFCALNAQTVIYVDKDTDEGGDGSNWSSAYKYLNDALDHIENTGHHYVGTEDNDIVYFEIWIAEGTYYTDEGAKYVNDDTISCFEIRDPYNGTYGAIRGNIKLLGGFNGSETSSAEFDPIANKVTLSNLIFEEYGIVELGSSNFLEMSSPYLELSIEGIDITGASTNSFLISNANSDYSTGVGGNVHISNCKFYNIKSENFFLWSYSTNTFNFENCEFVDIHLNRPFANQRQNFKKSMFNNISTKESFLHTGTFKNCYFIDNRNMSSSYGSWYNDRYIFYSDAQLDHCVIFENIAVNSIVMNGSKVENCTFVNNFVLNGSYPIVATGSIENTLFFRNLNIDAPYLDTISLSEPRYSLIISPNKIITGFSFSSWGGNTYNSKEITTFTPSHTLSDSFIKILLRSPQWSLNSTERIFNNELNSHYDNFIYYMMNKDESLNTKTFSINGNIIAAYGEGYNRDNNSFNEILFPGSPFMDIDNPLGADGIPFTNDDGLRLDPESEWADDIINVPTVLGIEYEEFDILGNSRIIGSGIDIGAFEYVPEIDSDLDGIADSSDAFPDDPSEYLDSDSDGIGDNSDIDDDNDGVSDIIEADIGSNPKGFDSSLYDFIQSISLGSAEAVYTLSEIKDLRPGSTMIEIHNGQATLTMELEESDDLGVWTNGSATSIQIPIDAEAGKKFFRFKMAE